MFDTVHFVHPSPGGCVDNNISVGEICTGYFFRYGMEKTFKLAKPCDKKLHFLPGGSECPCSHDLCIRLSGGVFHSRTNCGKGFFSAQPPQTLIIQLDRNC